MSSSAAELCAGLLSAADEVTILATSREPLAVAGEARYRLAPMAVPDLEDLAAVARAEAVALFAAWARSADARFAQDDQTGPAVARLVRAARWNAAGDRAGARRGWRRWA